jgi:hypothetical protein
MKLIDVANKLVQLCKEGKNSQAIESLYSKDIKSVEAHAPGGGSREVEGIEAVMGKSKWWGENHTIHSAVIEGPFPFDDKFAVVFKYDVTQKTSGKRFAMEEVAMYFVQNGKITREEFWYKG